MMAAGRGAKPPGAEIGSGFRTPRGEARRREGLGDLAEGRARSAAVTCEDCFFGRRGLCALGLDSPCPTFRPDTPDGLVPPRQPALLMRDRSNRDTAQAVVQAA